MAQSPINRPIWSHCWPPQTHKDHRRQQRFSPASHHTWWSSLEASKAFCSLNMLSKFFSLDFKISFSRRRFKFSSRSSEWLFTQEQDDDNDNSIEVSKKRYLIFINFFSNRRFFRQLFQSLLSTNKFHKVRENFKWLVTTVWPDSLGKKYLVFKTLLPKMPRFELRTSGVRSDRSTNWVTTTALC